MKSAIIHVYHHENDNLQFPEKTREKELKINDHSCLGYKIGNSGHPKAMDISHSECIISCCLYCSNRQALGSMLLCVFTNTQIIIPATKSLQFSKDKEQAKGSRAEFKKQRGPGHVSSIYAP